MNASASALSSGRIKLRPENEIEKNMQSLADTEIELRLAREVSANPEKEWLCALHFNIVHTDTQYSIGTIDIRLGYTLSLVRYGGHLGYRINPDWRGRHYAAKACKLLIPVALSHGMDVLWITCNPDNWASRKTCEWIGATLVEIVDLPPENDQYQDGERQKCRYRWILN